MNHEHFNPNPSVLAALSPEQQDLLLSWLDELAPSEVLKKVAAPPPEGFGIKTHPNSLKRFYAKHRAVKYAETAADAEQLLAAAVSSADFDTATTAALRQAAFELANSPRMNSKRFHVASRWILKLRDQEHQARALAFTQKSFDLAEKRLALDRERMELNAARLALKHFLKLQAIYQTRSMDDEDKVRAARDHLFNRTPDPSSARGPANEVQ